MTKPIVSAAEAVADIASGSVIGVGGFGLVGAPMVLIDALYDLGVSDLTTVSNNCGIEGEGLGRLLDNGQISTVVASFVGGNPELVRRYLSGRTTIELTPQGTLAEKLRAGGAGIPAFYTPTGAGTQVELGALPMAYGAAGEVLTETPPKESRAFGGRECLLEEAITTDFALVHAALADRAGNLVFHGSARNFNPLVATAGRTTIVEVEELVDVGGIDPDHVHLAGIFVDRIVVLTPLQIAQKRVEKLVLSTQPAAEESP